MSPLRAQLARLFLEPPAVEPASPPADARWLPPAPSPKGSPAATGPPRIGAVCHPQDARVAGGAAGLALVAPPAVRAAVVMEWSGAEGSARPERPAAPAAGRCAAALRADGLEAWSSGRLVRVELPAAEEEAVAAARAASVAVSLPVVLVVAGPRGRLIDTLLGEQGRLLLVHRPAADPVLCAMARDELGALGPPVSVLELPGSPGAAVLARSGSALVAPLRAAVRSAVGV